MCFLLTFAARKKYKRDKYAKEFSDRRVTRQGEDH